MANRRLSSSTGRTAMLQPLRRLLFYAFPLALLLTVQPAQAQDVKQNYTRQDYQIPMRDGVRLYTIVYSPKDKGQTYPMLMMRTPYSIGPYGKDTFRGSLGPNKYFA